MFEFLKDRTISKISDAELQAALLVLARATQGLIKPMSATQANIERVFANTKFGNCGTLCAGGALGAGAAAEKVLYKVPPGAGILINTVWVLQITNNTYDLRGVPAGESLGAAPASPYVNGPDYSIWYQTTVSVIPGGSFPWIVNLGSGVFIPGGYDLKIKQFSGGVPSYRILFTWSNL